MRYELAIEGMHCDACIRRLTTALQRVPGVEVEHVEIGSATVLAEAGVVPDALVAAIDDAGFIAAVSSESMR